MIWFKQTPGIAGIHWLSVMKRIVYKLMLLTFKSLNNKAPSYICDLITIKELARSLRSNASIGLQRKKINTVTYSERTFSYAAPELWNRLASHVKNTSTLQQFKTSLKAHSVVFSHYVPLHFCLFVFLCIAHCDLVTEYVYKYVLLLLLLLLYHAVLGWHFR